MNKNDLEKSEKNKHTIEITVPFNGVISGDNKGSISSNTSMSNENNNAKDATSKKGRIGKESDESSFSDDDTSKKGQMSNQSDASDLSDGDTSKKGQMTIKISQ
ncbi:hypothetical protein LGK95_14675 [Clostridium algoriphilum]|uniref:hypothetical protein n=1 Tax=Clostridium algoriphilum TaxID=198347 RepID=UPI001CF15DCA|nr:hypothetical protein [Clostridium algoriphilum]MCB2294743.1 hypothetical protein [Clostridium algoriphilum]